MAILAVLPGVAHLFVLTAAMVGVIKPAIWISDHLLVGTWSVPLLWAFVLGGPLFGVITGLTLELGHGRTHSVGRACGMFAWAMLIVGLVTTLPLPWILIFE